MSGPKTTRAINTYLAVFAGASVLSIVVAWIYSSYFRNDFAALLVYGGMDGNCDLVTQGLGVHCFGDYSAIHYSNLFQVPQGAEVVYPVITRIFRLPFFIIEKISSYQVGLVFYLMALLAAILFPVFYSHFKQQSTFSLPFWLCITCLNLGTISSLDRGNIIGFAVPFFYLFLVRFQDGDSKSASIYLTFATMVKPQLALFAVVFLWRNEIKALLIFSIRTFIVMTIPYLVFGAKGVSLFMDWVIETLRWSKSLPLTVNYPTNYSFNRVLNLFDAKYLNFSFMFGTFLIVGLTLPIILRKKETYAIDLIKLSLVVICMNSIVFIYYSVLLIPLWVVLFSQRKNTFDVEKEWVDGNLLLPSLLALASAPLAWPSRWRIDDDVSASGAYNVVPIFVTLGFAIFVVYAIIRSFLNTPSRRNHF
jgi:hypothetical protein